MRIASIFLAAVMVLSPAAANSQAARVCLPQAKDVVDQLYAQYGETIQSGGLDTNGSLVQLYANTVSGTWTIAVTVPGGPTCIVSSGQSWTAERRLIEAMMPGRTWAEWAHALAVWFWTGERS